MRADDRKKILSNVFIRLGVFLKHTEKEFSNYTEQVKCKDLLDLSVGRLLRGETAAGRETEEDRTFPHKCQDTTGIFLYYLQK